jgi:HlyD family secretion protein
VKYGDITNSVSASGSLVFPVREKLTFGSAGTVAEVKVAAGDTVAKGQLLAKFDDASLLPLQEAVVQAKINLNDALDTAQAEIAVTTAKIALVTAQKNLENAETPYSESDIYLAELAVDSAKIALRKAQDAFDTAEDKYDSNPTVPDWIQDYVLKKIKLAEAKNTLAEAEETLAEMKAGADPLQVELKKKQIEVAQANLNKAEAELAGIKGVITSLEGELKQLQIAAAQAALNGATSRLEAAIVLAPFDGIATSVNVAAGQAVSASTVVVEIVDPSIIEVSAVLDEIDVPQVKLGQRVIVSLSSLSDMELSGEVSAISSTSKTQSGVVTYTVTIRVTPPSGVQVREGMSATADIVVEEVTNVLLVPTQAITGTTNNPTVQVMVNGVIQHSTGTTTQQSTGGTIFPTDGMPGGGGGFIQWETR